MVPITTLEKAQPKYTKMTMWKPCASKNCDLAFEIDADTQDLKRCPDCKKFIRNLYLFVGLITISMLLLIVGYYYAAQ